MYKTRTVAILVALVLACQAAPEDGSPSGMSTPIVPATPPTIAVSIPVPDDGAVANRLSLLEFVQPLENSAEAFRLLTYGGGLRRRVRCTSNTNLVVQPVGAVVVKSSLGIWTAFDNSTTPNNLNPTTLTGGLVANTRYWIYGYESGGNLAFTASTTAPDVGLKYKAGDERYMYISTFITSAAGDVLTYTQSDNVYVYGGDVSGAPNRFINGIGVGITTQSLGTARPSQASAATVRYLFQTAGGTATVILTDASDDSEPFEISGDSVSLGGDVVFTETSIGVNIANGTGTGVLYAWVKGFVL